MERPYDIDIEFVTPKDKQKHHYKMRTTVWLHDMQTQLKCLDPRGQLNQAELWLARLVDTVEGLDDAKARNLDQYSMMYLTGKWLEYNDPNALFLEPQSNEELSKKSTQ